MKTKEVFLAILATLLLLAVPVYAVISIQINPSLNAADVPPLLQLAWGAFVAMVGWPAFQVALTNILKLLKILPDGYADKVTFWSSAGIFILICYLVFTGRVDLIDTIDAALSGFAKILVDIGILLGGGVASLAMNRLYYRHTVGYPVIGYSHPLQSPVARAGNGKS